MEIDNIRKQVIIDEDISLAKLAEVLNKLNEQGYGDYKIIIEWSENS